MRKVFFVLLVLTTLVTCWFVYVRMFVLKTFGPSSMLAVVVLGGALIAFAVSYVLINGEQREKVVGFWMVTLSTVITYLIVDISLGAMLIKPLSPTLIPDDVRHHKLVPDASAKFEQEDFSYIQRNNSLGLRGEEVDLEKEEGSYRILMLGDSFTMGKGVEDDETFSVLVQRSLNEHLEVCASDFARIEVINGGVDSYTPLLSYLYLNSTLINLDPDMVVLNLDNSDLVQESAYRGEARRDQQGAIVAVPGEPAKTHLSARIRTWIDGNMYITRLVLFYVNNWLGYTDLSVRGVVTRAHAELLAHTLESDTTDRSAQWNDIFDSISMIRDLANERSAGFYLSIYPWAHQVSPSEWVPGRFVFLAEDAVAKKGYDQTIVQMAKQRKIDTLNFYPAFQSYDRDEALYFDNDMHFTTHGHELMATEMVNQLLNSDVAKEICPAPN